MLRQFHESDYLTIASWMEQRGQLPIHKDMLSGTGLIVDNVACGFLIQTDSALGILEYFISNPYSDETKRREALNEITYALILTAKREEIRMLVCNTNIGSIKRLAGDMGFQYTGEYSTFCKEIK